MKNTNAELQERRTAAVPRGIASLLPVYAQRASNAEIWDVEGNHLIDFGGGIAVLNTGHLHPRVRAAVLEQLECFTHACFHVTPYEPYVQLAERLNRLVATGRPNKTMLVTTGAEAVENAVKIARVATGRTAVVGFAGAFHGRTSLGMALTGKVNPYKAGFGPFPPDIWHVPYPNAYRGISSAQSLGALDALFATEVDSSRVAAIIVEVVQGEGGYIVAPDGFLKSLRDVCDRHGILLVVDEIQTGFARTGAMFAFEHAGVRPDLVTMAKSLAGGLPLSAVTGAAEIMDSVSPNGLGGTFAGNPLACAAALAVLDVIVEERLTEKAQALGSQLRGRLDSMAASSAFACIGDVRGLGAMVAVELVTDRASRQPATELAKATVREAAKRGLVILTCGPHGSVVRFLAPLTAEPRLIDEGLDRFEQALAAASRV